MRVNKVLDFTAEEIADFVAAKTGFHPHNIIKREMYFLVQVSSEDARTLLLGLNGKTVSGEPLVIMRYRSTMSANEIFAWLESKLQVSETAEALGGNVAPRVRVISEEDPHKKDEGKKKYPKDAERSTSPSDGRLSDGRDSPERGRRWNDGKGKGGGRGKGGKGKGNDRGRNWDRNRDWDRNEDRDRDWERNWDRDWERPRAWEWDVPAPPLTPPPPPPPQPQPVFPPPTTFRTPTAICSNPLVDGQ